jgi:hypothetical protein
MSNFAEKIITQLDKGVTIFEVARMFGGINELLKLTKKYPYLEALIQTKLGGSIYCSASDEDEVMIPFELPFIILELDGEDVNGFNHYNAYVNLIIPELTEGKDMQILFSWLEDYLMDMGSDVGVFNDNKLHNKMIWVYVTKINGMKFNTIAQRSISDREVLEVIPSEYKEA